MTLGALGVVWVQDPISPRSAPASARPVLPVWFGPGLSSTAEESVFLTQTPDNPPCLQRLPVGLK